MKKYVIKLLILYLFISFFVLSCGTTLKNETIAEKYSCNNYEFSTALVEMVDSETNGEISGDTHFHSQNGNEIFFSYQKYNSGRDAFNRLKKEKEEADKIITENELMDGGKVVGKKVVFYAEKQMSAGLYKNYFLIWTKESLLKETSMFYWIRSTSLAGIEEMEKECKF